MDRDQILLNEYLLESFNKKFLLEKYHVVNDFNKFINQILENINDYNNEYQYTGWNFSNKECICLFNENIKYPIYLRVINDYSYENIMSITDRSESPDKIQLTINKYKLTDNKINMQSILFHECRHCLEMYVISYNTIKDKLIDAEKDIHLNELSKINKIRCKQIINIFSESEERARLDSTIHYLKLSEKDNIYNKNDIKALIEKADEYTLINLMNEYLQLLNIHIQIGIDDYMLPLYTGYLYKKYNCGECDVFIDIENIDKITNDNKKLLAKHFYNILEKNLENFIMKLYKAILVHIIEKD